MITNPALAAPISTLVDLMFDQGLNRYSDEVAERMIAVINTSTPECQARYAAELAHAAQEAAAAERDPHTARLLSQAAEAAAAIVDAITAA